MESKEVRCHSCRYLMRMSENFVNCIGHKLSRCVINAFKWLVVIVFGLTLTIWLIYLYSNNFFVWSLTPPLPVQYQNQQNRIYFIATNPKDRQLPLRAACAIEAASLHNFNSLITVLSLSQLSKNNNVTKTLLKIPNVKFLKITAKKILSSTPLEKWFKRKAYNGGPFQIQHMSDAIRLAVLWKYGGVYFDTDIWSVKGVTHLRNTVARESEMFVNGAVMIFDKSHPFLYKCMTEFSNHYSKFQFTAQGPGLLTRVIRRECGFKELIGEVEPKMIEKCVNISVLPPQSFYPIPYNYWQFFFTSTVNYLWRFAYTFHLWNKLSSNVTAAVGSGVFVEVLAKKNCPRVYDNLMLSKGFI